MFRPNPNQISAAEYFPPERVNRWGDNAWMIAPVAFCFTLQTLRNRFGRMIINRPKDKQTQRGLRTAQFHINEIKGERTSEKLIAAYKKADASDSQHKYANAADITFLDVTLEEVYDYIRKNPDEFPFMSFIEVGITWFHFDCRNQPDISFWDFNTGKVVEVVKQKPIAWDKFLDWHMSN